MEVSSLTLFLITIMACAGILAAQSHNNNDNNNQIDQRNHPDPVVVIKGPGVLPGPRTTTTTWLDDDLTSCWAGLVRTYGCIPEIYEAVYLQSFDHFNKGCCLNIVDIIDSCWPRMFPKHPQFSRSLKKYCAFATPAATTTTNTIVPKGRAL